MQIDPEGQKPVTTVRDETIKHVIVDSPVKFDAFVLSLERILGSATHGRGAPRAGLALYLSLDSLEAWEMGQESRPGRIYLIGNARSLARMGRWNPAVSLYSPVRLAVYPPAPGQTRVEYDLPSSLLNQFGSADVTGLALRLDEDIESLISLAAMRAE